jgi:ribosomal protein L11 methylase PrmA
LGRKPLLNAIVRVFEKIAARIRLIKYFYLKCFEGVAKKEIEMASVGYNDNVLVLGCGSVPYTTLVVAQTGAKVTTIDNDLEAVKRASWCISKNSISKKIKIEHADALDYSLEGFDVIMVPLGIEPKEKVLKRIFSSMRDGTRLVYRNPLVILEGLYDEKSIRFRDHTKNHIQYTKHRIITCRESVLVVKNPIIGVYEQTPIFFIQYFTFSF